MKIVFDCERMKYPYTGLYEYCHQLLLNLLDNLPNEDKIVAYIREKDKVFFPTSLEAIHQKSSHKFIFPKISSDIEIWHTTHQTSWYMPPRNRKLKRVLTIHDLNFIHEDKSIHSRKKHLKRHQKNVDLADHIIAISEFTKQDILKYLNVTVPITVIYNGCKFEEFSDFDLPIYKPSKKFIFALGTVNAKKNFHVLPCLLQHHDYELIIAGKGDPTYTAKIMDEAKKYNVAERVHITGPISSEDKYWYFKNCMAFAFPSLAEGFGIPVIEAMNFGKPIFLSNLTSLPEIGGNVAYYFENFEENHMQNIFANGLRHYDETKPAEKIRLHAEKFSWEKCAKEHLKFYKSLSIFPKA